MKMEENTVKKNPRELAVEMSISGKSMKEVSVALGIPYRTVYGWLRGRKSDSSGHNADRHLCKTCMYRAGSYERSRTGINCNYDFVKLHSRGCKVDECTVYEKGVKKSVKKRIRLTGRGTV